MAKIVVLKKRKVIKPLKRSLRGKSGLAQKKSLNVKLSKKASKLKKNISVKVAEIVKKLSPKKPASKSPLKKKSHKTQKKSLLTKKTVSPGSDKISSGTSIDFYDLPEKYGSTNVNLIARDPMCLYAYWEITPSSIEAIKRKVGSQYEKSVYTLRIHETAEVDFKKKNSTWFDMDMEPADKRMYINLPRDNASYYANMGIRTLKGTFHSIVSSNTVSTPSANVSDCSDMILMKIKHTAGLPPEIIKLTVAPKQQQLLWQEEKFKEQAGMEELPDIIAPGTAKDNLPAITCKPGERANKHDDESLFRELSKGFFTQYVKCESSDSLQVNSSNVLQNSSSGLLQPQKDFFFELDAELTVWGRTKPDAEVFLGDERINLCNNGSFSLKIKFPEGTTSLCFTAKPAPDAIASVNSTSIKLPITFSRY
jgi:hypothetical protein